MGRPSVSKVVPKSYDYLSNFSCKYHLRVWSIMEIVRVYFCPDSCQLRKFWLFHVPLTIVPTVMDACWCHSQGFFCCKLGTDQRTDYHNWKLVNLTWLNVGHCITKKKNYSSSRMSWYPLRLRPDLNLLYSKKVLIVHFEPFTFCSNPFTVPHTSPPNTLTKCLQ